MMSSPKIPQIQALRAVAAGLVLIYHSQIIAGGYIGVDIFYVISGYLITALILRELEADESFGFTRFYVRRAKRLIPSSLIVILSTGLAGWLLIPSSMRLTFGKDLIAASTYVSNFLFALWENDYQNLNSTASPFIHYWSLAVEEQFYLLWPLVIVLLYRIGKRRAVAIGVFSTFLLSFLLSLLATYQYPIWAFYLLPTRAWELAIGALILFLPRRTPTSGIFPLVAFLLLTLSALNFDETTAFPGFAAVVPVASTAVLIYAYNHWPPVLNTLSTLRVVQWIGKVSYPLYLWHWPILIIPSIALGRSLSGFEKLFSLGLIIILSALTHRYVEEPMRRKEWDASRTFKYLGVSTGLCVFIGVAIYASYSNSLTLASGQVYSLDEVRKNPINYEDGCHIRRGVTKSPKCEYGDQFGKETIVLYGDSHAAQWLPALDIIGKIHNIKIVSLTKSACSATELILPLSSQYSISDCQKFRDNSIERIIRLKPIAVITSSFQQLKATDGSSSALEWWVSGQAKLYARLSSINTKSIYISDTPRPLLDIPSCLSKGDSRNCDSSIKIDPTTALGFISINPTKWLCAQTCPAIVDDLVAYRDQSHISVAMSEHLAPRLESELKAHEVFKQE